MRRAILFFITVIIGCITSSIVLAATLLPLDAHISSTSTWTSDCSPYNISGTLTIDPGGTLVIQPGVEVHLAEGAGIVVYGKLQARGAKGVLIHFLPDGPETHWGNILFIDTDAVPSYNDDLVYRSGSILEYCVFEGGGNVSPENYGGGTVACIQASPVIQDCRFSNNRAPRGGAILCYRFSAPLIRRNTISENRTTVDDGGGICVFLYANPIIRENFLVRNQAARNGGAIYLSVAEAMIQQNTLISNNAEEFGGALYLSSTAAIVEENAFLHNTGWDNSGTLYLVADACPQIHENSLAGSGYMIYLDNVTCPVDLSNNWWHSLSEVDIELKIRKSFTRKKAVPINYMPFLSHPPESLPTQPVELESLRVLTDRTWTEELRYDLAPGARIHVEVRAVDRNPWSKDQTATRIHVLGKPVESFELILRETDIASGVFRGEAWVQRDTNPFEREIGAAIGDTIVIESTIDPAFYTQYYIGEAIPFVSDFVITSEIDITHVINPAMEMSWTYFDLRRHPQQEIQVQISTDIDFEQADILDTGVIPMTETTYSYSGARLQDGHKYFLRIRASDGERFSHWDSITIRNDNESYSFRMNSLPSVPVQTAPQVDEIVTTDRPLLQCNLATDREGDKLSYEFEVFATALQRQLLDSGSASVPQLQVQAQLPENFSPWWRVRIDDGFETTDWSELQRFYVNHIEEPPTAAGLLEPFGEIVSMTPEFVWVAAGDPDPLDRLHYYLQLSTTGGFGEAEKLEAGETTSMQLTQSLNNAVEYFWRVTTVDNTGRETRSKIGKFIIDTRPSTPIASYPGARQELGMGQAFQTGAAIDPDPTDQLFYDLQVAAAAGFRKIVSQACDLPLDELNRLTAVDLSQSEVLQDNALYYWRVRARDQHGITSEWTPAREFILNLRNDPPDAPVLARPQLAAMISTSQPQIHWQPLTDPDISDTAARLQTLLEFNRDPQFSAELNRSYLTAPGAVTYAPDEPLTDNCRWYMRLRALDDEGEESALVGPRVFIVNLVEEPPEDFILLKPALRKAICELENIELTWQEAVDKDLEAEVVYHVRVATDTLFLNPLFKKDNLTSTSVTLPGPLPNAVTCYWKVIAQDNTGLQTTAATIGTFRVDTTPSSPQVTHRDELRGGETLSWGASIDPNPLDRISYVLRLWEQGGDQLQAKLENIAGTELAVEELSGQADLPDNSSWEYSLTAVDNHDIASVATRRDWFRLDLVNDLPWTPVSGDADGDPFLLRDNGTLIEWSGVGDPDFSDPVETLSAQLQLDISQQFDSPLMNTHRIPPGVAQLQLHSLRDNTRWYYRIRTVDDEGAYSDWSVIRSFIVNLADEPPQPVTILRPEAGSKQVNLESLDLLYTDPGDPDYGDVVTSTVEIATDRSFAQPLLEMVCEGTRYILTAAFSSGTTYYLRVRCSDSGGLTTYSEIVEFTVDSHPSIPRQLNPQPSEVLAASDKLEWQESTDPDSNDKIRYQVEIARNVLFTEPVVVRDNLRDTSFSLRRLSLESGVKYYWRVRAVDNHGLQSEYCRTASFIYQ